MIMVALVIGLVLCDTLFGLFYYIGNIVDNDKTISVKPVVIINFVILCLMAITVIMKLNGV